MVIFIALPICAFGPFQLQHFPNQFSFYQHNRFDRVSAPNFILRGSPGSPELPVKYLHYIIPPNMKVTNIRVTSRNLSQIPGNRYIFPTQPIVPLDSIPPWVPPDTIIYNSDSPFPNKLIEVINSGVFDGARLVTIAVHPLQYRPQSRRLYIANNISFEFELAPASIPTRANIRGLNGQKVYDNALKSIVENDADIPLYYQPPILIPEESQEEEAPAQYIIITTNELIDGFSPFAEWLTDKGVPASVIRLSYILQTYPGRDEAEKMRNFIINAYNNCGTIWVLLGGDDGVVPIRYGWADTLNESPSQTNTIIPSDLYFSDLNGNWDVDEDGRWGEPYHDAIDIYPEVFVGRVLTRSPEEVNNWVNKILQYEQYGGNDLSKFAQTTWIYDSSASSRSLYPYPSTRMKFPEYFEHTNLNRAEANVAVDRLNDGNGLYQIYCHGTFTFPYFTNAFLPRFIGGPWYIHGFWSGSPSVENDGLNRLQNSEQYYIIYSVSCDNAAYDNELPGYIPNDTTIADAFTDTYSGAGAVAFLGNTRMGWQIASNELHDVFCKHFFNYEPYQGLSQLGTAESWSKTYIFNPKPPPHPPNYPCDPWYYLCHAHNLFGSPEMQAWINCPSTMEVEHLTSIPAGALITFSVRVREENSVPLSNVRVCLHKLGEIYEIGYTDENGEVTFDICAQTEGELKITCYRPLQEDYAQYLPTQTICQVEGKGSSGEQGQVSSLPKELSLSVASSITYSNLKISYGLPKDGRVKLVLYDLTGKLIKVIMDESQTAGYYKTTFDLRSEQLSNGVYFLTLELDKNKKFTKINIIR
jgi:hypothetical protein